MPNTNEDDDELLCDWIGALAWLETDAANAAAAGQVRRLRELAVAVGKQPVARAGLEYAMHHFPLRFSLCPRDRGSSEKCEGTS